MASELLNVHQLFASPYSSHLHEHNTRYFYIPAFFKRLRETHLIAVSTDFAYLCSSLWDIGPRVQTGAIRPNIAATTICVPTFLWFYRTFTLPSNRSILFLGFMSSYHTSPGLISHQLFM